MNWSRLRTWWANVKHALFAHCESCTCHREVPTLTQEVVSKAVDHQRAERSRAKLSGSSQTFERLVQAAIHEWDEQPSGESILMGRTAVLDFLHDESVAQILGELEGACITGFYEELIPQFRNGLPRHEMETLVTCEEVEGYVAYISALREAMEEYILKVDEVTHADAARSPSYRRFKTLLNGDFEAMLKEHRETVRVPREALETFFALVADPSYRLSVNYGSQEDRRLMQGALDVIRARLDGRTA